MINIKKSIIIMFSSIFLLINGCSKTVEDEVEKDLKKTEEHTKESIKIEEKDGKVK